MKKSIFFCSLICGVCLFSVGLSAQEFKEKNVKTQIAEATVFLNGAQLTQKGTTRLEKGNTALIISGVSPYLDPNSLQVKGEGNFTVVSVNHRKNYLAETPQSRKIDSLKQIVQKLDDELASISARKEVLNEKQSLLNQNKDMNRNQNISLAQLKSAMDFYDTELSQIKKEALNLQKQQKEAEENRQKINNQLNAFQGKANPPQSEVVVRVEAEQTVSAEFTLTYLVANAGWFPKYDIRLDDIEQPLNLRYKAEVFQNTGVDWNNVKLVFSNGDPNQSSVTPELETWRLNYARNTIFRGKRIMGKGIVSGLVYDNSGPLPGASVIVQGTTIGTQTDFDGRYSLTLPTGATDLVVSYVGFETQTVPITSGEINIKLMEDAQLLQEVVVTGYSGSNRSYKLEGKAAGVRIDKASTLITEFKETQTTVEIAVEKPYTLKSGGEKMAIDLRDFTIPAEYHYVAVPKLDKDAFLIARITNWNQYNLLEGEANLYFEKGFVGRTILNANALSDTLEVSLGRDRSIVIEREKVEEFSKKRTLGANKIETRGIKIAVRNNKKSAVNLFISDQLPVSVVSDITVTPGNLYGGQYETSTGLLKWQLNLAPAEQRQWQFDYEVKYPKRENVVLD